MTADEQAWIDGCDYEALLRKWRNAPAGDPMFQGDTGDYYAKVMYTKRRDCLTHVEVSKKIGWSGK